METRDRINRYSELLQITINENGTLPLAERDRFQQAVLYFYDCFGRSFPWRETIDPYHILVSEIMLQQTQTSRVMEKFPRFIQKFPTFQSLSAAPLSEIVTEWQGLGYNRRAKALHHISRTVVDEFDGELPDDPAVLETFPMIGKTTAHSITAFAFNKPVVFIETNIRSVFIYTFFYHHTSVRDKDIFPLVEATLFRENPRKWYNALMDYGVHMKQLFPDITLKSASYTKQPPFKSSNRQLRGIVLKALAETASEPLLFEQLISSEYFSATDFSPDRVKTVVNTLEKEGFITICSRGYELNHY